MYDMLKPIDKGVQIETIKLIEKKGGKSDFINKHPEYLTAAVIVCSDSIFAGKKTDKAGKAVVEKLAKCHVTNVSYHIIADEPTQIVEKLDEQLKLNTQLIIYCGGTGLSNRDITPDTIAPLLDKEINSIMEAARVYGQQRTPYSMLSRGVAGIKNNSLVLTLPGSTKGAQETMDALFPFVLHVFSVMQNKGH
jgi:molybdenum cofactor synthesis domain-containing protein